jgi:hypothetical protein
MKWLQTLLTLLIDYLPVLATLGFGVFVSLEVDRTNVSVERSIQWVLILLTGIVVTLVVDKFRSTKLTLDGITALDRKLDTVNESALRGSEGRYNLRNAPADAKTIDILAWNGLVFFRTHKVFLRDRIQRGCHVRMLIIDKESLAARIIVENASYAQLIDDIRGTEMSCTEFVRELGKTNGSFELRKTGWLTPYGMVVVDMHRPGGIASLGLHPVFSRMEEADQRYITVDARSARDHYDYFTQQFDKLWNESAVITSSKVERRDPQQFER